MKNLQQACDELLESDLTELAYISGCGPAFLLILTAIRKLIKEHGPNYITTDDLK